jgi:hypothetical protein
MHAATVHLKSEAPRRSGMATFANGKVLAAERALPVVTRHATLSAPGSVMIERLRLRDLPALRQAGANLMTLIA